MQFSIKNRNNKYPLILIITIFGIIFSLISFPNHYLFRTSALDLGMFNHAIFQFSHLKMAVFSLGVKGHIVPYLGDHFSLITILLSPLYYIFGSYTLLIVQIVSILFGGVGIYKYAQLHTQNKLILLFVVQFFSIWGIYTALAFNFHTNVLAAMFVIWFVYYYTLRMKTKSLIFFILIIISKENMALWMIFILIGLMLKGGLKRYKDWFRFEIPLILISLIYFIVVMGIIMPGLLEDKGNNQLSRYKALGESLPEIIRYIIYHPINTLQLLWKNTTGKAQYDDIKIITYQMVLFSGGIALIARPYYLVMLIPIIAQKMFTNNPGMWGLKGQYSIEFAPVLSLALIDFITSIKRKSLAKILLLLSLIGTVLATKSKLNNRIVYFNKNNIQFYKKRHYKSPLNIDAIYQGIKLVPDNVSLSVQSRLAPHLAARDTIYLFPHIKTVNYIALITKNSSSYPIKRKSFDKKVNELKNNNKWDILYNKDDLLILKRKIKSTAHK
jgi:uncharacterized membrane protein